MTDSFKHIVSPLRFFCGENSLEHLGPEIRRTGGKRVLIFCAPSIAKRRPELLEMVCKSCEGLDVFAEIVPHSPLENVRIAAQKIRDVRADTLIVIGGGSAIVTARAANILAAEKRECKDLCSSVGRDGKISAPKLLEPKLPMLIIPTTPTTATVKCGAAVLDQEENVRLALFDPKCRAASVFVHPDFVDSPPENVVKNAAFSTLTCAIEAILCNKGDPMADAQLIQAVRLLKNVLDTPEKLSSTEGRCQLMLASILCGLGSDYTGFGLSVVLGHSVCALFPVQNGYVNSIVLPQVLQFNAGYGRGWHNLAYALELPLEQEPPLGERVAHIIIDLLNKCEIPKKLRDLGVPHELLTAIAADVMGEWYLKFNPREVTVEDVLGILEKTW